MDVLFTIFEFIVATDRPLPPMNMNDLEEKPSDEEDEDSDVDELDEIAIEPAYLKWKGGSI
jgi:hypothetical protein